MKLISWNVNGLRAAITKEFDKFFKEIDADIFSIQETKMQEDQITDEINNIFNGYYVYWNSAVKKGYSGTAVFTKKKPINVTYGIGIIDAARIDEINILQATYEAMREAISKLSVKPDILLNDAVTIPGVSIRQVPIIKGDAKSISIGAASIVAKVTRDRLMVEYDKILPQYGFASNKGYGSAEHIKALQEVGPSPIHRASFIKNFV